ncbi:hypothetical protein KOR42_37390 [Thalassoglobus neptunius]|uniref:SLBB domain protein n=1 Tax=Thalassoglobus neptunius TaxID=1938619 RepID=A0A5C5WIT4_9PLAN|nr:hypothetical protein [Thalassoglobus neptunius]TWT49921.1 hypothetical protein KOR42_37390 [Thalassoglobus neptunius]
MFITFNRSTAQQVVRTLLTVAITLSVSTLFAQPGSSRAIGNARPRMKVLNLETTPVRGPFYYSIVGAVDLPGVFVSTDRPKIILKDLLAAAGGLTPDASLAVRLVRHGSSTVQIFDNSHTRANFAIEPDDVVVIVPRRDSPTGFVTHDVTPVACLGLANRPVVLPLESTILTVTDLLKSLRQHDLAPTAVQVLDPYARQAQELLLRGSVVVFDPSTLNLESLNQIQEFPPAVPLNHREMAARIGTRPASQMNQEPQPKSPRSPLAVPPNPAPTETPKIQVTGITTPDADPPVPNGAELSILPETASFNLESVKTEAWTDQSSHMVPPPPEEPNIDEQKETPAIAGQEMIEVAPPLPPLISSSKRQAVAEMEKGPSSPQNTGRVAKGPKSSQAYWIVIVAVSSVSCIGLWIAIVWSRHERRSNGNESETVAPQRNESNLGNPVVQEILDNSIGTIEEDVIIPHAQKLHGEPQTVRIDMAHDLPAPHHLQNIDTPADSDQESAPSPSATHRLMDVEVIAPKLKYLEYRSVEKSFSLAPTPTQSPRTKPVPPRRRSEEFDVVIPVSDDDSQDSPLERALRSLSESKQQ